MPSDKERMAAKRAGIAAWNSGGPGGGNTFPLEFAIDAAIDALSAAEKEREGDVYERARELAVEGGDEWCIRHGVSAGYEADAEATFDKYVAQARSAREGDIIEKLREWAKAEHDATVGWDAMGTRAVTLLLARLDTFLNDLQEQSTPRETCERVGVGQGTDTWDPVCDLPPGHVGPCNFSGDPAKEVASDG